MNYDDGYNKCKKDVKEFMKSNELMGIWELLELELN